MTLESRGIRAKRRSVQKSRIVPTSYSVDDADGYVFADVVNIPETIEYTSLYEVVLHKMIIDAKETAITVTGQEGKRFDPFS